MQSLSSLSTSLSQISLDMQPNISNEQKVRLNFLIQTLTNISPERAKLGDADALVKELLNICVELKSLSNFKQVAYLLFSGERFISYSTPFHVLAHLFLDEEIAPQDLADAISIAFENWKKEYKTPSPVEPKVIEVSAKFFILGEERDPEDTVIIHHGGGLNHINAFLSKDPSSGYECDRYGKGIYFTPVNKKTEEAYKNALKELCREIATSTRAPQYACRNPIQHFDSPTVLVAKVKAKYLLTTVNSYEVVVPQNLIDKIEKLAVISLRPTKKEIVGQLSLTMPRHIQTYFTNGKQLEKRLEAALNRVLKGAGFQ